MSEVPRQASRGLGKGWSTLLGMLFGVSVGLGAGAIDADAHRVRIGWTYQEQALRQYIREYQIHHKTYQINATECNKRQCDLYRAQLQLQLTRLETNYVHSTDPEARALKQAKSEAEEILVALGRTSEKAK